MSGRNAGPRALGGGEGRGRTGAGVDVAIQPDGLSRIELLNIRGPDGAVEPATDPDVVIDRPLTGDLVGIGLSHIAILREAVAHVGGQLLGKRHVVDQRNPGFAEQLLHIEGA